MSFNEWWVIITFIIVQTWFVQCPVKIWLQLVNLTYVIQPSRVFEKKISCVFQNNTSRVLQNKPSFNLTNYTYLYIYFIYLYFPTSNKMVIIGTLPFRFSDKNPQLYKGSLIRACAWKLFILVKRYVWYYWEREGGCIYFFRKENTSFK
jgi:hypothetical protein